MRFIAAGLLVSCVWLPTPAAARQATQQQASLRIVVVEGEDAVNIIQQKSAVQPVIEVRDANNLPVAGATVQFTLQGVGGGAAQTAAFANGQSVLTVTTNAAGRAVSGQLQAVGSGAVRIQVQASYQGSVATATISQTNFATAAEAAQAGRTASQAGSAGSSAGAGAGGTASSVASTAGAVAGAGAAAVGVVQVVDETKTEGCTGDADAAKSAIDTAVSVCTSSSSAQCNAAGQQAASSLGQWCSCDGRSNVDAALRREGVSLDELARLAGIPNVSFPAACR